MKNTRLLAIIVVAVLGISRTQSAQASITFGSGANQFNMEFVPIGSAANATDTTGKPNPAGSVSYAFQIGRYEVSRDMVTKANAEGNLGIALQDMTSFGGNGANKPATGVSWYEAATFVNWLNTSQGHHAAYNLDGSGNFQLWSGTDAWQLGGENLFRHRDAHYWLPSADEWYKSAFFNPNTSTYYDFPTASNAEPTAVASGAGAGTAVYNGGVGPADIMLAGGLSPFGTMGQGGNVWEWEETEYDLANDTNDGSYARGVRGGSWNNGSSMLSSSNRSAVLPADEDINIGFRVAALSTAEVPEPTSLAIWGLFGFGGLLYRWRQCRR